MTFYQLRTLLADPNDLLEVYGASAPTTGAANRHADIRYGKETATTLRLIGREGLLGGTETR